MRSNQYQILIIRIIEFLLCIHNFGENPVRVIGFSSNTNSTCPTLIYIIYFYISTYNPTNIYDVLINYCNSNIYFLFLFPNCHFTKNIIFLVPICNRVLSFKLSVIYLFLLLLKFVFVIAFLFCCFFYSTNSSLVL